VNDNVEETLGWEAEQRPRAGLAAIATGLLLLASNGATQLALRDLPDAGVIEALRRATSGSEESQVAEQVLYIDDHALAFLASGLLSSLALLLLAVALGYLFRALSARRPETSRALRWIVVGAPVTAAVGSAMAAIARAISANDFAGQSDRSTDAARDALTVPVTGAGAALYTIGSLFLALGIALLSLNAMRVGLLTRFLGVLGIIAGIVWLLPIGDQLGLVRTAWLVFLGLLILGRGPGGVPAAWQTGRAEPWPTQQQIREQREAAKAPAEAPQAPAPAATPRQPQRQKRKRRK
jgi:hypothetical protein